MARAIDGTWNSFFLNLSYLTLKDFQENKAGLNTLKTAVESQPTLTPPNEWVSVEDAVPDPGERVLATDGIFVGEAYRTSADSWHRHTGFPWRDGVTGRTVKYWMLLPAPPAKEGDR